MRVFKIKQVNAENMEDLNLLCVPIEITKTYDFIKGMDEKRKWAINMLRIYNKFASIAYVGSIPVGLIQYDFHQRERIVQIRCVFVPKKEHQRKGIATKLLDHMIKDMKESYALFDNMPPLALVTYAFETPSGYPQHLFFKKKGFIRVYEYNPYLLYYPLKEGFIYKQSDKKRVPKKEEEGKVSIFYDPFCPWAIFFSNNMEKEIKEIASDIPIEIKNVSDYPDKKELAIIHNCIVNGKSIKSFVIEKEKFQKEVRQALGLSKDKTYDFFHKSS